MLKNGRENSFTLHSGQFIYHGYCCWHKQKSSQGLSLSLLLSVCLGRTATVIYALGRQASTMWNRRPKTTNNRNYNTKSPRGTERAFATLSLASFYGFLSRVRSLSSPPFFAALLSLSLHHCLLDFVTAHYYVPIVVDYLSWVQSPQKTKKCVHNS